MQIFVGISTSKTIPLAILPSRYPGCRTMVVFMAACKISSRLRWQNPASCRLYIEDVKRCSSSRQHARSQLEKPPLLPFLYPGSQTVLIFVAACKFSSRFRWQNHPSCHLYIQVVERRSFSRRHANFRQDLTRMFSVCSISRLSNVARESSSRGHANFCQDLAGKTIPLAIRFVVAILELERITYSMQTEDVAESVPKTLYLTTAILCNSRTVYHVRRPILM